MSMHELSWYAVFDIKHIFDLEQHGKFAEAVNVKKKSWKFLGGGGGSKVKNHPWGGYGYFLEPHIYLDHSNR